jgi:O-antigen/teichoic acid export membrane protein
LALAVATVLADTLRGLGRPLDPAIAEVGGALTTAGLLVWLVPRYGIEGAAVASTVSYTLVLLILWLLLRPRLREGGVAV